MTTPVTPPYGGSLLALVGANTPVGYAPSGGWMFIDHQHDKAIFQEFLPTTGDTGLKAFTIGAVGTELVQATQLTTFGDAGGGTPNHTYAPNQGCYHPMGKFFSSVDLSNSCPIAMVDATTLLATVVVGLTNASTSTSTNDDGGDKRFLASNQMVPLQNSTANYIVSRGLSREVGVFDVDGSTVSVTYAANITENLARLGPGMSGSDIFAATFYVIGDFSRGGGSTDPAVLYEYVVDGSVYQRTVRSIAPADIDATWTNFVTVSNPGYDLSDNTVLCFFSTFDAVATTDYLVKINPKTAAIVWKLAVSHTIATNHDLPRGSFNGTLGYFQNGTPSVLTLVDLSDGTTTTQDWNDGFGSVTQQVWDYATGSITGEMGYTESTGIVPDYLGAYLAANGNVIPSARWGRIFSGAPYNTGGGGSPGSAPQRAWTYSLDGHHFYVLDLDAEGTFAYDIITQHWSKFITASTTPLWNMAVGTTWQNRVVAGDRATGDVWELSPNAVQDGGTEAITRVLTGLVTRRSRNAVGVGALRIAGSSGVLSGSGTSTFSLRFSDDQGNTWVGPYTITLTAANYSQEIAFRGLGSFAAPGRVFELTDVGGLVRIDNCTIDPELEEDDGAAG